MRKTGEQQSNYIICTVVYPSNLTVSPFVRLFGPIPILLQNDSHR